MDDNLVGPKGPGTLVYFVLGALVVAVAALAFFALGGQLGGGPQPQPIIVTPPAATPAPAPAPVVVPPRDRDDHRDRNNHDDHNDRDRH